MLKPADHLRKHRDRYRLTKREDGIWYLLTGHRNRYGMTYDVYDHSDTHLAACLPPRIANRLLREHPDVFTLHQDAEDAKVLLFLEDRLHEMADVLRLRYKRRMSEAERQRVSEMGKKHWRNAQEGLRKKKCAHFESSKTA